jgi:hypothetical protein
MNGAVYNGMGKMLAIILDFGGRTVDALERRSEKVAGLKGQRVEHGDAHDDKNRTDPFPLLP